MLVLLQSEASLVLSALLWLRIVAVVTVLLAQSSVVEAVHEDVSINPGVDCRVDCGLRDFLGLGGVGVGLLGSFEAVGVISAFGFNVALLERRFGEFHLFLPLIFHFELVAVRLLVVLLLFFEHVLVCEVLVNVVVLEVSAFDPGGGRSAEGVVAWPLEFLGLGWSVLAAG